METLSLIHLSGPRRGVTDRLRQLPATIGSEPGADVLVPGVAPRHAVLLRREDDVVLQDCGSEQGTFLAGEPLREAELRDGDVFELGSGGPKLRFRHEGAQRVTLRQALQWARPEGYRLSDTGVFMRALARETAARTSRAFRLAVSGLLVLGLLAFYFSQKEIRRLQSEVVSFRETVEKERRSFEARIEEERRRAEADRRALERRIEEFRHREEELSRKVAEATSGEVRYLRDELQLTRGRLATLEGERAAGERIIREYGAGVALIQASYAFHDAAGRPLRYRLDEDGDPLANPDGSPVLDVNGNGPIHSVDYFGTAFLVDPRGLLFTNRHVAEPWWKDEAAQQLASAGYTARFVLLRAFFPREPNPLEPKVVKVSDTIDLAILQVDTKGRRIPVLPLDRTGRGAVAGQPVVVVGYPTGLEAILAKADSDEVRQILAAHGTDAKEVTEGLAQRGLIRPSTTQGHIGDVTRTDIVFDAATTHGGSGGPVFNKNSVVIAVEYAVHARFAGNAFGIPIRYALELLKSATSRPRAD